MMKPFCKNTLRILTLLQKSSIANVSRNRKYVFSKIVTIFSKFYRQHREVCLYVNINHTISKAISDFL